MSVQGRPNSWADVRLSEGIVYHAGKGREGKREVSKTIFEATIQEPRSSIDLIDERPKGGHTPANYPRAK